MIVDAFDRQIDLGPNPSRTSIRRWKGDLSPEPETVEWIRALPAGKVFYDIGANVGRFSVLAAVRGLKVIAFEPDLDHYNELVRVAERNELKIMAFNVALGGRELWAGSMGPASRSTSAFIALKWSERGVISVPLAKLIAYGWAGLPVPDYLKLDVDGDEMHVLWGIGEHVRSIKELLVEIDIGEQHARIVPFLQERGFTFDPAQVHTCRVTEGKYAGLANYIFSRGDRP